MKKVMNKLLYLIEEEYVSQAVYTDNILPIYSLNTEVKKIMKKHFLSLDSYSKLVRKQLPLKNKIPIYCSSSILLFKINSKNGKYMINFFNLLKICSDKDVVFIFKDGSILRVDVSITVVKRELRKIYSIIAYINNLNL